MGMALVANTLHFVNACKKTNVKMYRPFMLAMLGGISLKPCAGWSTSYQILTWVCIQLSTHLLKISITVSMYSKNFGLKHVSIVIKMFSYKVTGAHTNLMYCLVTVAPLRIYLYTPQVFTPFWAFDKPTMNERVLYIHPWVYIKHLTKSRCLLNSLPRRYPSSPFL